MSERCLVRRLRQTAEARPKRGDWVKTAESKLIGFVRRVARDGSWADVRWRCGGEEWSKRMPTSALIVQHTIPFAGGTVTDMTRERELEGTAP